MRRLPARPVALTSPALGGPVRRGGVQFGLLHDVEDIEHMAAAERIGGRGTGIGGHRSGCSAPARPRATTRHRLGRDGVHAWTAGARPFHPASPVRRRLPLRLVRRRLSRMAPSRPADATGGRASSSRPPRLRRRRRRRRRSASRFSSVSSTSRGDTILIVVAFGVGVVVFVIGFGRFGQRRHGDRPGHKRDARRVRRHEPRLLTRRQRAQPLNPEARRESVDLGGDEHPHAIAPFDLAQPLPLVVQDIQRDRHRHVHDDLGRAALAGLLLHPAQHVQGGAFGAAT